MAYPLHLRHLRPQKERRLNLRATELVPVVLRLGAWRRLGAVGRGFPSGGGVPPGGGLSPAGGSSPNGGFPPASSGAAPGGGAPLLASIRPKRAAARRILKKYMTTIASANAMSSAIVKR